MRGEGRWGIVDFAVATIGEPVHRVEIKGIRHRHPNAVIMKRILWEVPGETPALVDTAEGHFRWLGAFADFLMDFGDAKRAGFLVDFAWLTASKTRKEDKEVPAHVYEQSSPPRLTVRLLAASGSMVPLHGGAGEIVTQTKLRAKRPQAQGNGGLMGFRDREPTVFPIKTQKNLGSFLSRSRKKKKHDVTRCYIMLYRSGRQDSEPADL